MLKRVMYLLLFIAAPVLAFCSDDAAAQFKKGNDAYAKSQYKEAVAAYQKLVDGGYQSASVYFNLGNAYYKSGDIASSLLYYEKAHKLSPGDEDIRFNIQLVNSKTTDKVEEAPEFFVTKWWHGFILAFSVNALGVLSVLLFIIASLSLILYRFTNSVTVKKASFYSALVLLFLGICTIFVAGRQVSYFENHREAIIFSNSVTAKSSPARNSKSVFVLHDGTKVDILEHNNDWLKVRISNGIEGWISVNDAREI